MTMIEALLATQNNQLLARPKGAHYRGGYYIENSFVWDYNPLRLAADLRTVEPVLALWPSLLWFDEEWEVIPR